MTVYELIEEIVGNIDNPNAEVKFYNESCDKYMKFDGISVDLGVDVGSCLTQYTSINFI